MLSLTGALPVQQTERDGVGAHISSAVVVDRVGLDCRPAFTSETAVHAGCRLGKLLMTGPHRPRPNVAEGVKGRIYYVRFSRPDGLVIQPQLLKLPGAVVLRHHVGILQQPPEDILALLGL